MNPKITVLCVFAVLGSPLAFSQGEPQVPGTGPDFVPLALQDGMTEVELGKLALRKSSNPGIKQFADTMVRDHTKADEKLQQIASNEGIPTPEKLDSRHAALVSEMSEKSGADFDNAYLSGMVADHKRAVSLFENEAADSDPRLSSFAESTLPTLRHHEEMAERLASPSAASNSAAPR